VAKIDLRYGKHGAYPPEPFRFLKDLKSCGVGVPASRSGELTLWESAILGHLSLSPFRSFAVFWQQILPKAYTRFLATQIADSYRSK